MDHESVLAKVELTTAWVVLAPMAVGLVVAWAVGHLTAHLMVRAVAQSMDMTSRAGHRRYYRITKG